MKEGGFPVWDYGGDEARRDSVEDILNLRPQAWFLFYNHGDEQGLLAQGGRDYIIDKSNAVLLQGRVVYTLACLWGKDGGWDAHRQGAKAVHCYVEIVGFMTSALKEFQEAFNHGFKLLHEMGPDPDFAEILRLEREKMTELADQLNDQGNFLAAAWMTRNRDTLRWYNGGSEGPESKCFWRRLAVRWLGSEVGWNLTKYLIQFVTGAVL